VEEETKGGKTQLDKERIGITHAKGIWREDSQSPREWCRKEKST
jgi:hypothetical protein